MIKAMPVACLVKHCNIQSTLPNNFNRNLLQHTLVEQTSCAYLRSSSKAQQENETVKNKNNLTLYRITSLTQTRSRKFVLNKLNLIINKYKEN